MQEHPTLQELEAALPHILDSPKDRGRVEMITCRPSVGQREILDIGTLDQKCGLIGDRWQKRGNPNTPDPSTDTDDQITIINSRIIQAIAGNKPRWTLSGDQLVVDIDITHHNMPPGTTLCIGSAVVEITAKPHTGCSKFMSRFGKSALIFVSGNQAMQQRRRGANAKILKSGTVRIGDFATKVKI